MSLKGAPTVAAWMLEHLVPGDRNESLEGDLLEELRSGRSAAWYRRQVSGSLAAGWRREMSHHRSALGFAVVWSIIAPAWIALGHTKMFMDINATAERLNWPWSAFFPVALRLSLLMVFLWTGLILFSCWSRSRTKHFDITLFGKGFARGTAILMPAWLAMVLLNALLQTDIFLATPSRCLPFFVATLCATWSLSRKTHSLLADRPLAQDVRSDI
jgi:hypothetical protein